MAKKKKKKVDDVYVPYSREITVNTRGLSRTTVWRPAKRRKTKLVKTSKKTK